MIYFVQAEDGGPIKIGFTETPTMRFTALSCERQTKLVVLGVVDGNRAAEKAFHAKFSPSRLKGEWFHPTEDLLDFIQGHTRPWDGTDETPSRLIALKCRQEYKDWVVEFARHLRTTPSQLIDRALFALAKSEGVELPPDR